MKEKNMLAIITARGGSKRIPSKNIKEFCGTPIMAYSIEAARESGVFETIMVSTDDTEIAAMAQRYGAEVPFMRSSETANDYASTADVLREVLLTYKQQGKEFSSFCCLYPTAPFVTPEKLRAGAKLLFENEVDSVVPVVRFSFPPQRGFFIENGVLRMMQPTYYSMRSQDIEPVYHDCGQFYFAQVSAFLNTNNLITERTFPMIMDEGEVQDIDTLDDWKMAEIKFEVLRRRAHEAL